MTFRTAFIRGEISETLLGLWLGSRDIPRTRLLIERHVRLGCFFLMILFGISLVYFRTVISLEGAVPLFSLEFILASYVVVLCFAGHSMVFIRHCRSLSRILSERAAFLTEKDLRKQANAKLVHYAREVRAVEKALSDIKYTSHITAEGTEQRRAELMRGVKNTTRELGAAYDICASFGLVSEGYGQYFDQVDNDARAASVVHVG